MRLRVDGLVGTPFETAERSGPVAALIERAAPRPESDHATVHSATDGYRASIPLADLRRGMLERGRLTIPDGRTLCWNVKDVVRIELTHGRRPDSVPDDPPH